MNAKSWRRETLIVLRRCRLALRFAGRAIDVHPSSWVSPRSDIRDCGGGLISIGRNCEIHPYSMILTYGGEIHIGDNCSLNPFSIVYGYGGVRIGNGVRIAAHTVLVSSNHVVSADNTPIHESGNTGLGIHIGDNVWLGTGVSVLDGVNIGRNCVVGAGSVVTKSVPDNTTVAGVPARAISQR
jgi:acetyltransferase-like isoleucine patch superfamily enzyme